MIQTLKGRCHSTDNENLEAPSSKRGRKSTKQADQRSRSRSTKPLSRNDKGKQMDSPQTNPSTSHAGTNNNNVQLPKPINILVPTAEEIKIKKNLRSRTLYSDSPAKQVKPNSTKGESLKIGEPSGSQQSQGDINNHDKAHAVKPCSNSRGIQRCSSYKRNAIRG